MTIAPAALPKDEIHCAQCGGLLNPDEGQVFLTCPYCGSAVFLDKSKVVFHWALACTVTPPDAAASLRRWMAGNQTVKDLDTKSKVTSTTFEYFPVWYAKTRQNGQERIYLEPAAATSISEIKALDIPAGDLKKYEPALDAQAVAPTVPYPALLDWLVGRGVPADQVAEAALVHLPVYIFKYDFAGKSYTAMVEGASGKVFANLFPAKAEAPYFAVAVVATVGFLCVSSFPLIGLAADGGSGAGLGLLACLVGALVVAVPVIVLSLTLTHTPLPPTLPHLFLMPDVITGLACPNCSGALTVREGQKIVKCPYCSARSQVSGDRGVGRYQVARRVDRDKATLAVRGFWSGLNRAFDLSSKAQITELFLVYLPYWRAQGQLAGWMFGQREVSSGNSHHLEPREVQFMEDMDWTSAAGDVAEFGVDSIALAGTQFTAYDPDALHQEGMVFEPTGSETEARDAAQADWEKHAQRKSQLDRVSEKVLHILRRSLSLVYYPLWVGRYSYRNRAYQVVVDGYSGRVLYGKAPGNIYYRALMLVGGTGLGAFVLVDGLALALTVLSGSSSHSGSGSLALLAIPVVGGASLIYGGYRLFRWGEEIEERHSAQA